MRVSKSQSIGVYAINAILLINLLSPAFLPTFVMAQTTTEDDERRIEKINKGQWDGALGVKSFTLPGVDTSPVNTTNPVTGEAVEHSYKQEDGTYNFASIKMEDMFQGFNQAQHNAYANDLDNIRDNPHVVQDNVYQMELDKTTYADTECSSLETVELQQRCELAQQALILDEIRANPGSAEFLGATDSILTDFSSIADGTHPYYAELQNEECVETLIEGEEGGSQSVKGKQYCIVAADIAEHSCEAERFVKSTKVSEKTIIKYPLDPAPGIEVVASGFEAYAVRNCPNFESSLRSCIELDLLTKTKINRSASSKVTTEYTRSEIELRPAPGTKIDQVQRLRNYTVRSDFLASNMIQPSNLGSFVNEPSDYITEPDTNLLSFESGYRIEEVNEEPCNPAVYIDEDCPIDEIFVKNITFGNFGTAFDNADIFRTELSESQLGMTNPPHIINGYFEAYETQPVEPPNPAEPITPPLLDQSFDNTVPPYTVSGESGVYEVTNDQMWNHLDTVSIHGYHPQTLYVTDTVEYPSDDLYYYNFNRVQLVFMGQLSSETSAPPEPVEYTRTNVTRILIDDIDTYPRVDSVTVLGVPVDAEFNVFDQGTYGVDEYFPADIRVVGEAVESYTVKTIGRPTNRYQYELEIEFSDIAPFEVIADIHRIDEQGFRPRAGEEASCQGLIDLYTTGRISDVSEITCDFQIADDGVSSRVFDSGVDIDWPHVGYFGFMPNWTPDASDGLPNFCYEATINVDADKFDGFSSVDRDIVCSGLEQPHYDACMNGEYCEYNAVTGGITCQPMGENLKESFSESCASYLADEDCTHLPNETRCEESMERDGQTVCIYESHVFECGTDTEFNAPGTNDSTEVDCGTPRDCIYGECNNLAQESNDAFLRASAAMQMLQEAKDNTCILNDDGTANESSCKLFPGKATRCKSPTVWGAADCCDPDALGMGGIDIVAYWQMARLLNEIDERVNVTGYMAEAWGAFKNTADGTAIGDGLGAVSDFANNVNNLATDAYTFVTKPIIAGWEATFKTLGFSPEGEFVGAAADFFGVGATATEGANLAAEATKESAEVLSNTASQVEGGAKVLATVGEDEAITGVYKYLAHGINEFLMNTGFEDIASKVFVTGADGSIGFNTGNAAGEFLNTAANVISYIMLAYTIYNLYNLAVNVAFACDEEDFETTQKIKLLSTHYVGSWCSKKLFIGGCVEHSQSHCIYPSVFSRIIAEEFRRIMAEDQGISQEDIWLRNPTKKPEPDNLDCTGFSLDEVANIDWDRVDLTEYENIVLATLKYDPNNMPEDFVKSDYMVPTDGPQAGETLKESGMAQAAVVAYGSEQMRGQMNVSDMTQGDPDYMAWFAQGSAPESKECLVSCDKANGFFYDSEAGLCVSEEKVPYPANFSCDTGAGFTLFEESPNTFTCKRTQTVPLTAGCREGFVLDEVTGLCSRNASWFEEKNSSCPAGYRLSEQKDSCDKVQTTPKVTNCTAYGPGFVLIDNVCQQTTIDTTSPFLSCNTDDYIIEDGQCVLRTQLPPTLGCPAPLEYDASSGQCLEVSYDTMPATFSCESFGPDYVLSFGQCVKKTVTTGTLTCEAGFSLVGDVCEKTFTGTFDASTTCPDGTIADPNDTSKCFKRTQSEPRPDPYCEDPSFTLVDNTYCKKVLNETVPAEPRCLSGYEFDTSSELCIKTTRYPPSVNCPSADMTFDALTGLCRSITNESLPPVMTCNEGDELVDGQCVTSESTGFTISCDTGYFYNQQSNTCIKQEVERNAPSYWCPIGTVREGNKCMRYDFTEGTLSCEAPAVLNETSLMCEETVIVTQPPQTYCPAPSYMDYETGVCMVDEVIPADVACPSVSDIPYTYNAETRMCEREMTVEEESIYICPPDEIECNTADEREPVPQCTTGSVDEATGRCVDYDFTYPDAIAFCDNVNHVYNATTNRCEYSETLSAVKCGPPLSPYFFYDPLTETCKHENRVSPISSCVSGFVFDGTSCVRVTHTPMACSDPQMTFNDSLNRCVKTTVVPAVVECQSPYVVDPGDPTQCRLPPTHEPICSDSEYVPVGYDGVTDRCVHLGQSAQHDAYAVCPDGSINQDNEHCYSGNTAIAACPSSYSYNAASDRCEFTPSITLYCTGETTLAVDPETGQTKCMYEEARRPVCAANDQYYDIALNKCVKEDIVQGTMVCNDTPPFYRHLEGNQCKTVSRIPYESPGVCSEGYYPYSAELCESQLLPEPPEFVCPDTYQRNMSAPEDTESPRCVKYIETTPECDVGFTLDGNFCKKRHYDYEPIESCQYDGQTLFGNACKNGQQSVAPVCPSNHFYSAEYNICIDLTEVDASRTCLSENFTLDTNTGKCNSTFNEAPVCLTGYALNTASNLCEQIYMAPVCDEANGFFYDTDLNTCRKYETEPASYFCDPNERDDGDGCTPIEEPTCEDGWSFEPENDRCFRQENKPHEPNCDPGEVDFNGQCIEEEAVDCSVYGQGAYWDSSAEKCMLPESIPANPDGCGPDQVLINDVCYDVTPPSCPAEAPNYNSVSKICEGTENYGGTPYCNPGEYDTGSGCTPQQNPSCANAGFTYSAANDACIKTESFAKDYECAQGTVQGAQCEQIEPVNCPNNYTDPDGDGICTERTDVPAESACSNGATNPPTCETVTEYPATCPNGFVSHNNTTCKKETSNTQLPSCPSGLTYSHSTNDCRDLSGTSPTESCGSDSDGNPSNGCTTYETDNTRISCSAGLTYNSTSKKCEDIESKTCASGGVLQPDGGCASDRGYFNYCDEDKYPSASVFNNDGTCYYLALTSDPAVVTTLTQAGFNCVASFGGNNTCDKEEAQDTGCSYEDVGGACMEVYPPGVCQTAGYTSIDGTSNCRKQETPTCSGSFSWNGTTCERTYDNGTYTQTCPAGENLAGDGKCYKPSSAYSCSSGYSLVDNYAGANNDRCVRVDTQYQSKQCNSGGTLQSSGQCRTVSTGTQYYFCNLGSLEGDRCAFYDDEPGCDTDNGFVFYPATSDCRKYSSATLESCPTGWTDNGASCSRQLTEPPACSSGYYYEASTNKCHLISADPYEYNCGSGTYVGNGQCEEGVVEPPSCLAGYTFFASTNNCRKESGTAQTYSCPPATPSYTLDGKSCKRDVPNPPHCNNGTYTSARGMCTFNYHPHNPNCTAPYVDANGRCEHYMPAPPNCPASHPSYNAVTKTCDGVKEDYNYVCDTANGFTPLPGDVTTCEKTTYDVYQCPVTGQVLDTTDDKCKTYQYASPSDQCDQLGFGTVRNGGQCETYYDQGFVTCPSGYRVDYDISKQHAVCHKEQTQTSVEFCPFNYVNVAGTCVEVSTNDIDYSCMPGWSRVPTSTGFECQRFTGDVYPSYECADPSSPLFDAEACRALATTDLGEVGFTCQGSGYVYDPNDHICRLPAEGYPVNEYCADPNYTLTPLDPSEIIPGEREYKCVYNYIDAVEPILSCPNASPAYELKQTGNCVRSLPTTSILSCQGGYTLNTETNLCSRETVEVTPPDISCSSPYSPAFGGQCMLSSATDASKTCDPVENNTGQCSMEIDGSTGIDEYGIFTTPISLASETPFEISMLLACLESGEVCTLLGNSAASGDAIYIPASGSALNLRIDGVTYQYALGGINISADNHYSLIRNPDNEVELRINGAFVDKQPILSSLYYDWAFRQNGLGEHSKIAFNSAAIANYSAQPYEGHVYSISCDEAGTRIEDINLDNDITLINSSGGVTTAYSGGAFSNNAPPIPISESEWDIVNGLCERITVIDEVPPTLTCDGEVNDDGLCMAPSTYPPTATCDTENDFEYNSLTFSCERTVITESPPDSYSCNDSGHVIYDGMCQYTESISPEGYGCGDGYQYDEATQSCTIYLVITDEAVLCQDGHEQRNNVCYEREYVEPLASCPTGSVYIGSGLCQGSGTERRPPNVYCEQGTIVGPNCVEIDTQTAIISCSDPDYQLLNNVCYKEVIATSTAPSLTCLPEHIMKSDGLCHFENIVPPQIECPDIEYRYNASNNLCERVNEQNFHADLGCPDDGQDWIPSSGTMCERVISSVAVTRTCEDPSADDSGEQCYIEREETHEPGYCQSPYTFENGQCSLSEYQNPGITCPDLPNIRKTANGCMEIKRTTQAPNTDC